MSLAFADFELDPASYELRRQGRRVPLEPQAIDVLTHLVAHRQRVVSKEELMDAIWGGRFVTESAVSSRIKQCRRALGDDGQAQSVIKTVHGRGYRFAAPVREAAHPAPPDDQASPPQPPANPRPEPSRPGLVDRVGNRAAEAPPLGLIGRAAETQALRDLLEQAQGGHGRLVLVTGEPGVGKTALLTTLRADAARAGVPVLAGRGVRAGGPYRPLAEAMTGADRVGVDLDADALRPFRYVLGRVLPTADPAPAAGPVREEGVDSVVLLGEGLLRLLSTIPACVLVVEDVHDADPDTLAVLDYLTAAVLDRPVLVVLTRRDWPRPPGLEQMVAAPTTLRLALARLDDETLGELVDAVRTLPTELRSAVVRRSEGLPVVAVELAFAITGQGMLDGRFVPESLAALFEARMAALSEPSQRLLAAAAVLGGRPDWELVPAVACVDEAAAVAALRDAVALHLLTTDGGELRWRHGMVRQAVWAKLLPLERRSLGRAAAALLATQGTEEADAQAAELLAAVGEVDSAVEHWLRLPRSAMTKGALRGADELLARVEATGRRPAAAAIGRVELRTLDGNATAALEQGLPALAAARGDEHAELCLRLARAAVAAGRYTDAEDLVHRAGRPTQPTSLVVLSDAALGRGRLAEATRSAVEAVAVARGHSADLLCEALCTQARAERLTDPAAAAACFAEAARVAAEQGLAPWQVEADFGLATLELLCDESPQLLVRVHDRAEALGLLGRAAQADLLLTDHLLARDGPAADLGPAVRLGESGKLLRVPSLCFMSTVALASRDALAGDEAGMERRLTSLTAGPILPPDMHGQLPGVRALLALVRHDLPSAAELLDAALAPLARHQAAAPPIHFGAWVLVATLVREDAPAVRRVVLAQTAGLRRANRGALRYADAVDAGRGGDSEAAREALAAGDALLSPLPWWQRCLRVLTLRSAVIDRWGDPVPQLRADLTVFEQAGEHEPARCCRDLLRAAGAPTRAGRGEATVPAVLRAAGVTSRELDVLRLVEQGLSNAEIACRLFLSPRTVEAHVASLLARSGAPNRHVLRGWSRAVWLPPAP